MELSETVVWSLPTRTRITILLPPFVPIYLNGYVFTPRIPSLSRTIFNSSSIHVHITTVWPVNKCDLAPFHFYGHRIASAICRHDRVVCAVLRINRGDQNEDR